MKYIYLDNNATTKIDKKVVKEMLIDLKGPPLNPSSTHFYGRYAHSLLVKSRRKIASLLEVQPEEIIFSSGATESLNLLISGYISNYFKNFKDGHIITSNIEHSCIYNTMLNLQKKGVDITFLKPQNFTITKEMVQSAIKKNTKLTVLSAANSETGNFIDFNGIAQILKKQNIYFIVDGVGILGKKKFSISDGISAMIFNVHKIHGPKGIGFIYLNSKSHQFPIFFGGTQEYNKRAGTENLSGILGASKAVEILFKNLDKTIEKISFLKDYFEFNLEKIDKVEVNFKKDRVCNTSSISFPIPAQEFLILLEKHKILASHASACITKTFETSRVLLNMGLEEKKAKSTIRFSFSKNNTFKEIKKAVKIIRKILNELLK